MKKLSIKQLAEILKLHKKWLVNEPDGKRANLSGVDLTRAALTNADLSAADLRRADLRRADLRGANFSQTDLRGAKLIGADLTKANLSNADLTGAALDYIPKQNQTKQNQTMKTNTRMTVEAAIKTILKEGQAVKKSNSIKNSSKKIVKEADGLKLYVWEDFGGDYAEGLAFAIASSEQTAKKLILDNQGLTSTALSKQFWGKVTVHDLSTPFASSIFVENY